MKSIKAYWFSGERNFGDLLTPLILKGYGLDAHNCAINDSQALVVGSILQDLRDDFQGHILGSGLIHKKAKKLPLAKVWSLRGKLTQSLIDAPKNTILGDPGLLAPSMITVSSDKQFALGIVPHYVDQNDQRILLLKSKYPKDISIIDVRENPEKVINRINQCHQILSSSLHGLVIADSLGISNRWILLSEKVIGAGFKFHDYYSAFNREVQPMILKGNERLSDTLFQRILSDTEIEDRKLSISDVFLRFSLNYKANESQMTN